VTRNNIPGCLWGFDCDTDLFFANTKTYTIFATESRHQYMIVTFEKEYLHDLYETGNTADKKHRFQPEIVRKYKNCINLMRRLPDINALAKYNGLNLENLKGDKQGISSIRVNKQYRIEFSVKDNGIESLVTICNILELSNHYK
jgi:proteic killer suppression protein